MKTRIKCLAVSSGGPDDKGCAGLPRAQSFISECGYFLGETNCKTGERFVYYMRFSRLE